MKKSAMAVLVFMVVFVSHLVFAGNIDSPGPPSEGSKMPGLLDIYDYLNSGTLWTDPGSFQEPAAGPGSTMKTTKHIYDDSKTKFDQCNAGASDVAETKKFFSTQQGNWGVKTGTGLISTGDAVVAEVLATKTFSNSGSAGLTGTMTNVGQQTITPTTTNQAITQGYHSGTGYAEGDVDLTAGKIKDDVVIFGVTGTFPSDGTAVAGEVKTGSTFYTNTATKLTGAGTKTLSAASDAVNAGYYAATTLSAVDADLTGANIVTGKNIFGKAGSAVAATGNAVVADVLATKTFSNSSSVGLTGTMTNKGAGTTITPGTADHTIAAGYWSSANTVKGDAELTAPNIKKDVDIFGVVGSVIASTGTAGAGDVLTGKTFSNATASGVAGTMTNNGAGGTITPGTTDQAIAAGYWSSANTVKGDADLVGDNIRSTVTIFGVAGNNNVVNTSSGDAVAGDILNNKKAWVDGSEVTGNVIAGSNVNGADGSKTFTIPNGLYSGSKEATANDADLVTGNIKSGVTIFGVAGKTEVVDTTEATNPVAATRMKTDDVGFVNGNKVTGTGTKTLSVANDTVAEGYYAATTLSTVDTDLAAANIKKDVNIFGKVGTYPLAGVEKTGQTTSYGTGSDGDLQKGVAWPNPRFTDNTDGTVTDNLTGLIWLKNASCDGQKTWANALTYCNNLAHGICDLTDSSEAGDWRLPNVKELSSLIDWAYYSPALSNDAGTAQWTSGDGSSFSDVQSASYWSSTTYATNTGYAWAVRLDYGNVGYANKPNSYYVWPVRGGQ